MYFRLTQIDVQEGKMDDTITYAGSVMDSFKETPGLFQLCIAEMDNGQLTSWSLWANEDSMTAAGPKIQEALLDPTQLECMAKNIYFEAAIESTAGKLAVAQVTLNRVNSTRFPNTICGVVKQGRHYSNGFPVRDRCQLLLLNKLFQFLLH